MLSGMLTNMGNTEEGLPTAGLLCAKTLEITGDGMGDEFGRKGSWMTASVVLCQHTRMNSPARGPIEDSPAAFLRTFRCH
jgi:hypothetical protein